MPVWNGSDGGWLAGSCGLPYGYGGCDTPAIVDRPRNPDNQGNGHLLGTPTHGEHGLTRLREEVIALVVDHDECREVPYLDPPDRFHAKLRVLQDLDLGDAVLCQPGRRAADRAEVEPAELLAGPGD